MSSTKESDCSVCLLRGQHRHRHTRNQIYVKYPSSFINRIEPSEDNIISQYICVVWAEREKCGYCGCNVCRVLNLHKNEKLNQKRRAISDECIHIALRSKHFMWQETHAKMASAYDHLFKLLIIGDSGEWAEAFTTYFLHIFCSSSSSSSSIRRLPLLHRFVIGPFPVGSVCSHFVCKRSINSIEFIQRMEEKQKQRIEKWKWKLQKKTLM